MTEPTSDEAKAARRAAIQLGAARAARHDYLTHLAAHHNIELPVLRVGDDHAVDHAINLLETAGADIDWTRLDIPTHTNQRKRP